jgi:hypothetical protein
VLDWTNKEIITQTPQEDHIHTPAWFQKWNYIVIPSTLIKPKLTRREKRRKSTHVYYLDVSLPFSKKKPRCIYPWLPKDAPSNTKPLLGPGFTDGV